jgi:hypothetical protein
LRFGSSRLVEPILQLQPQAQVERRLEQSNSTQTDQPAIKGSGSSSVRNLLKISGGDDLGKPSSPGVRARTDAAMTVKGRKAAKSKPGKSGFAESWVQNSSNRSRPAAANRLAQQLQSGQAEGGNGLFSRFSA